MKRNRIHVLIVEDEQSQGKALEEGFKRQGYTATWCDSSVLALTLAQRQEFHCLVIDCLLPKMNGIDLASELNERLPRKPKIILFSGIYRDKNFMREASERVGAVAFLTKPFELAEMIGQVDQAFADELRQADESPLLPLYTQKSLDDQELVRLIENEPTIHAFHVPKLLQALQKTRLSGELTLITAVGDVNSVLFYDGRVFSVRTPDKDSFFGALAVDIGFVSADELLEALHNPARKLIGQKLIESMSLSPHAITLIMEEQLALRLSQCVQNSVVTLSWTAHKFSAPDYALNPQRFEGLMDDWIKSKMDLEWIRAEMTAWGAYEIHGQFHPTLAGPTTLKSLLADPEFNEAVDLPYLFRQLLHREAWFGLKTGDGQDFSFLDARLSQMLKDYKEQNYFQILGVGEKAHLQEINKAYGNLQSVFNPQVLPENCPPSVILKCTNVFKMIENAYLTLAEDTARAKYMVHIQSQRSQLLLENEPVFRAGILEMQCGMVKEASLKFQSLIDRKLEFRDLRSYRIWAGLKAERGYSAMTLDQVPPEERHSPAFMMARGVYHRNKGQYQKALQAFRTAHILDPRLSIAKNELQDLAAHLEKNRAQNKEILREVTSVLENLFGRSRRGA